MQSKSSASPGASLRIAAGSSWISMVSRFESSPRMRSPVSGAAVQIDRLGLEVRVARPTRKLGEGSVRDRLFIGPQDAEEAQLAFPARLVVLDVVSTRASR